MFQITEATDYTNKMLYVHAISNMKLPKVLQFFAPQIANVSLSRHYRLLLLWATITAIDQNPEQVCLYPYSGPYLDQGFVLVFFFFFFRFLVEFYRARGKIP